MKTDTELLNWLEDHQGYGLISDDNGHWACVCDGTQSLPIGSGPQNVDTAFWIEKKNWKKTIRKAIESAIKLDGK